MGRAGNVDVPNPVGLGEMERFRNTRLLHNHWSRPIAQPAYYWYLTFETCLNLHSLGRQCQDAIDFPYYDLTPLRDLHLTLDRIAFAADITANVLSDIEAAALHVCQQIPAFDITIGPLGGTPGAIGFAASPAERIGGLRDTLRAATLTVYPGAPARRSGFHPHVAIAYANSDNVPAADVIAAVEKLNATVRADVTVTVKDAALVLLERQPRSYAWQAVSRFPLARR
jgi:2'-5' RNA ligase